MGGTSCDLSGLCHEINNFFKCLFNLIDTVYSLMVSEIFWWIFDESGCDPEKSYRKPHVTSKFWRIFTAAKWGGDTGEHRPVTEKGVRSEDDFGKHCQNYIVISESQRKSLYLYKMTQSWIKTLESIGAYLERTKWNF